MIISKEHKDALIKENHRRIKKVMTDLAAGHISKKDADMIVEGLKTPQIKPGKEIKGVAQVQRRSSSSTGNTHKRKKAIKSQEVK